MMYCDVCGQKIMDADETAGMACDPGNGDCSERMERIYVCSPLRPKSEDPKRAKAELEKNLDKARRACRMISKLGGLPLAPHIYGTQFLDDDVPDEREEGIRIGLEWLMDADEVWVFSEFISEGMRREIDLASELGIPVRMFCESEGLLAKFDEKCGCKRLEF